MCMSTTKQMKNKRKNLMIKEQQYRKQKLREDLPYCIHATCQYFNHVNIFKMFRH